MPNYKKGKKKDPATSYLRSEEAVHDVVEGLDELGQHHRRGQLQQNLADPLCSEKSTLSHRNTPYFYNQKA